MWAHLPVYIYKQLWRRYLHICILKWAVSRYDQQFFQWNKYSMDKILNLILQTMHMTSSEVKLTRYTSRRSLIKRFSILNHQNWPIIQSFRRLCFRADCTVRVHVDNSIPQCTAAPGKFLHWDGNVVLGIHGSGEINNSCDDDVTFSSIHLSVDSWVLHIMHAVFHICNPIREDGYQTTGQCQEVMKRMLKN